MCAICIICIQQIIVLKTGERRHWKAAFEKKGSHCRAIIVLEEGQVG